MAAVLLALAASASWGVSDFLGGVKTRSLNVLTVLAVSSHSKTTISVVTTSTPLRRASAWPGLARGRRRSTSSHIIRAA